MDAFVSELILHIVVRSENTWAARVGALRAIRGLWNSVASPQRRNRSLLDEW